LEIALGALLGAVITASLVAGLRFLSIPHGVLSEEGRAMQAALEAATSTLPHLRRGLTPASARRAAPYLRALTQAAVLGVADSERLLAVDGPGWARDLAGQPLDVLLGQDMGAAVLAPLVVRGERLGSLAALYPRGRRVTPEDTRVVANAAALVAAQVELAHVDEQEERLARAELRALRAQISPHFVYNALAAVASHIHSRPDEARELLTDFADFTRYAFRRERPYVTLAEELQYVEKYLNLERARFGERLRVRLEVAPEILPAVMPVLSLQPLVENAVRHGMESAGRVSIEIVGADRDSDAEIVVRDDGRGMAPEVARAALAGRSNGIGLSNVDRRLRSSFGAEYGLAIESRPGQGCEVRLTVPKSHPGVRAA
jgi:two-component system, LytTR family, sensor kinase